MVLAPPLGERDRGRPEAVETEITKAKYEKDEGKVVLNDQETTKDGEGCSGTRKEEATNQDARRIGQCVPKSKMVPRLHTTSDRVREEIQYMKERALIGKFVGIWPTENMLVGWIKSTWKP